MDTFSALLALCAGNSPVTGEFPAQWPVTRSFDVFFDLRLNKRLSKQSWGWCFETPSSSLWRQQMKHESFGLLAICVGKLPLPDTENVPMAWRRHVCSSRKRRSWWRHQMETFSALRAICAGNSPVPGEFPTQRRVTRSFGVFFDLHPNKRLSKQWWGWWFETQTCPLWRHSNVGGWVFGVYRLLLPYYSMG